MHKIETMRENESVLTHFPKKGNIYQQYPSDKKIRSNKEEILENDVSRGEQMLYTYLNSSGSLFCMIS